MSKTDRTRPLRVKAMDAAAGIEAKHDHRTGPCDLPARPTKPLTCLWGGDATTTCYWAASHEFMVSPQAHCNAPCHSKKRDDHAIKQAAARRTANRAAEHDALVDLSEHGLHDTLADVFDWTRATLDPDFDNTSDFHAEMARFARLREQLTATTGLSETSLVVDVMPACAYECCEDCGPETFTGYRVEILHNDGRREKLRIDAAPMNGLVGA